jgi:hypothetical protein
MAGERKGGFILSKSFRGFKPPKEWNKKFAPSAVLRPGGGLEIKTKGIMKRKMKMYRFDSKGVAGL